MKKTQKKQFVNKRNITQTDIWGKNNKKRKD